VSKSFFDGIAAQSSSSKTKAGMAAADADVDDAGDAWGSDDDDDLGGSDGDMKVHLTFLFHRSAASSSVRFANCAWSRAYA
jgi:hypothetical protein